MEEELKVVETMETNEAVADTYTECEAEQPKIEEAKDTAEVNNMDAIRGEIGKGIIVGVAVNGAMLFLAPFANEISKAVIKGTKKAVHYVGSKVKGAHEKHKDKKAAKKEAKAPVEKTEEPKKETKKK